MKPSYMTSRELNHDSSRAMRSADNGPVFITDRGVPSHVLITVDTYTTLTSGNKSIVDMLVMDEGDDIDFDPPKLGQITKRADLG